MNPGGPDETLDAERARPDGRLAEPARDAMRPFRPELGRRRKSRSLTTRRTDCDLAASALRLVPGRQTAPELTGGITCPSTPAQRREQATLGSERSPAATSAAAVICSMVAWPNPCSMEGARPRSSALPAVPPAVSFADGGSSSSPWRRLCVNVRPGAGSSFRNGGMRLGQAKKSGSAFSPRALVSHGCDNRSRDAG